MEDYKQEIVSSRVGCLGSSDGRLLKQVSDLGYVPKSAYERLSVVKGLTESQNVTTAAMQAGDRMEMAIFGHLAVGGKRYVSNPLWESKRYSRENVKLISHPDIVLEDEEKHILYVYEVKTTKYDVDETYNTYEAQLFIHWSLAHERAKSLGRKWVVKLFLVHYSTAGTEDVSEMEFDTKRLTLRPVCFRAPLFDIKRAMGIVNEFLEDFSGYDNGEEVDSDMLPAELQEQFNLMEQTLLEIKEREDRISEFKTRLYNFLCERNIKSIKAFSYTVSRVDPSESIGMDYKAFFDSFKKAHPKIAAKAEQDYRKVTKRKGYAVFKLK